jgi:hypothetical protein
VDSFQQILFRLKGRIPTRDSESKRFPQMASFLAGEQANFINFAGDSPSLARFDIYGGLWQAINETLRIHGKPL